MTIQEIQTSSTKGNEFISASCSRCFRKGQMMFHFRIDNPSQAQRDRIHFKALQHDKKGMHPITIIENHITR